MNLILPRLFLKAGCLGGYRGWKKRVGRWKSDDGSRKPEEQEIPQVQDRIRNKKCKSS